MSLIQTLKRSKENNFQSRLTYFEIKNTIIDI